MNRKEFIKFAGLTGADAASFGPLVGRSAEAARPASGDLTQRMERWQNDHRQAFNMSGYAAPAIDTVRIGIIGTGNRGSHHAGTIVRVDQTEIRAAANVTPERYGRIRKTLAGTRHDPEYLSGSDEAWKKL